MSKLSSLYSLSKERQNGCNEEIEPCRDLRITLSLLRSNITQKAKPIQFSYVSH